MSEEIEQKLKGDLAVKEFKSKFKGLSLEESMAKKWHDYALRGSVQSRKAKYRYQF